MQFKAVILTTFITLATAQDLSGLPVCARPCFLNNVPVSGCSDPTDFACICASDAYINTVTSCVLGACSLTDALAARKWAVDTCAAAGVPI